MGLTTIARDTSDNYDGYCNGTPFAMFQLDGFLQSFSGECYMAGVLHVMQLKPVQTFTAKVSLQLTLVPNNKGHCVVKISGLRL